MRKLAAILGLFVLFSLAAADVTVSLTVPTSAIPRLQSVCAEVQAAEEYETFTNEDCLAYFLKIGLRNYAKRQHRVEALADTEADFAAIEAAFPSPPQAE